MIKSHFHKALGSHIVKSLALVAGFIAALPVARSAARSLDYYLEMALGDWPYINPAASLIMYAACAALLVASVVATKGKKPPIWRGADLTILAVAVYATVLLCVHDIRYPPSIPRLVLFSPSIHVLGRSATAYAAIMAFVVEATARWRDKQLSLRWLRIFKLCPVWRATGFLTAALLVGNFAYLLFVAPAAALGARLNVPYTLAAAAMVAALVHICGYILSLSAEYERANAEKLRAERFKAELITNVSHDIRTPLTSIINYVGLLKSLRVENADFVDYVGVLDKKSARLKILIDDLMEASKASTGNIGVNMQNVDLAEITGQIAGEFDDLFNDQGLTLVLRSPEHPVSALADSRHVWRVLENLFGNVVKYALPGTRVFAESILRGGVPVLAVKNTSREPLDQPGDELTEYFMRGDKARQTEGSGLGLYIAASLMELMGGRLTVRTSGDQFEAELSFKLNNTLSPE